MTAVAASPERARGLVRVEVAVRYLVLTGGVVGVVGAVAAGAMVGVLELAGSNHAPAAATALLIATGLAKPGAPLVGLVVGLAAVIAVGPALGRAPWARRASTVDEEAAAPAPTTGRPVP